jgi:hypothetical protein
MDIDRGKSLWRIVACDEECRQREKQKQEKEFVSGHNFLLFVVIRKNLRHGKKRWDLKLNKRYYKIYLKKQNDFSIIFLVITARCNHIHVDHSSLHVKLDDTVNQITHFPLCRAFPGSWVFSLFFLA